MKKKLNTVFFSLFFLCSAVAEAYFIRTSSGDYVSVIGIGIVLLISGYLLMDSIRSKLAEQGKGIKSYVDRMYQEETQRRTEQLTELINLQKATYMATKKNTSAITDQLAQLEELLERVEGLERDNGKALEGLELLQKKSLEGQRNALNLEINYNKENTKQLMRVLREVGAQEETRELLYRIAERIEKGTVELRKELQNVSIAIPSSSGNEKSINGIGQAWNLEDSSWSGDSYVNQLLEEERKDEKQISTGWNWEENAVTEVLPADTITEAQPEDNIMEDQLENITAEMQPEDIMMEDQLENITAEMQPEDIMMEDQLENIMVDMWSRDTMMEEQPEDIMTEVQSEAGLMEAWSEDTVADMFAELRTEALAEASTMETVTKDTGWFQEEKTPDTFTSGQEAMISEADEITEEVAVTAAEPAPVSIPEIIPLYDDPNKALSADEIARLFASLGQ
jgi:hypothetical protein